MMTVLYRKYHEGFGELLVQVMFLLLMMQWTNYLAIT